MAYAWMLIKPRDRRYRVEIDSREGAMTATSRRSVLDPRKEIPARS